MPSTSPADRSRVRLGTVLGGAGLTALVACAVALPPALSQSTTGRLHRVTDAESTDPTAVEVAPHESSSAGLIALAAAYTQAGKAYEWGGTGPDSWDCSGLVQWAFRQAGVDLPRVSEDQALVGDPVPVTDMSPGDVITFRDAADHVGIYAGDGQVFNAYDEDVPIGLTDLADLPPIHNVQRF